MRELPSPYRIQTIGIAYSQWSVPYLRLRDSSLLMVLQLRRDPPFQSPRRGFDRDEAWMALGIG